MRRTLSFVNSAVGAALLTLAVTAGAEGAHPPSAITILSPLESPDPPGKKPDKPEKVVITPYYPGYCPPGKHGILGYGILGKRKSFWYPTEPSFGDAVEASNPEAARYGGFTGGPRDESRLLHLGGAGPSGESMTPPSGPMNPPVPMNPPKLMIPPVPIPQVKQ